jgi:hypothetical protein
LQLSPHEWNQREKEHYVERADDDLHAVSICDNPVIVARRPPGGIMKRPAVLVYALAACVLLAPLNAVGRALAAGVAPTVADFHRLRKLGVRYIPMVMSGVIGNALRAAVSGSREQP